jgi:hypothetical protein
VTYARLRVTDPGRWLSAALHWRRLAATAGRWAAEVGGHVARLRAVWSGTAATAAAERLLRLRRGLDVFRLTCWEADQALSEFAAALSRARALLDRAVATARRAGLAIDDRGTVVAPHVVGVPGAPLWSAYQAAAARAAAGEAAGQLAAALTVAAAADATAAGRLAGLADAHVPEPPGTALPPPEASPAEVRRWWDALTPAQQRWLAATRPAWLGPRDGVPVAYRDLANRLLLEDRRAELASADGTDRQRLRAVREALDALGDRLADGDGPRGYLLRLDLAEEGRAVVALGDPNRAAHVLTHVPGMTADLASYRHELARAEGVAVRAGELSPASSTSAVMWLGYDAPDFLDEAAGRSRADAGAAGLRRFQDGLRAAHETGAAHLTVLGHSYGSLVVGSAAAAPGLQADDVVFVGSPGVGVDAARDLAVPPGRVWATTSGSDAVQYAAVSARSVLEDLAVARIPVAGPAIAFARPEDDLWHGRNPADPAFGARVFASQPGAGHTGYWEPGDPALDALAGITVGRCPS